MFARIEKKKQSRCRVPHRIEHAQMVRPEDLETLSQLKNLSVTCQPNNLSLDISMINACAGDRAAYAYPLKSILKTGLPMMLGSDAPVADPSPLAGIYSAVTRRRMDHTPETGWHMEQALSVDQAVKGYTLFPAVGSKTLDTLGTLTPGRLADIVVLERDIFTCDTRKISDTKVEKTFFNGKCVYNRE